MSKKAIVTGASRGIGRAIAVSLANSGYDVAFTYAHAKAEAEKTKQLIEDAGQKAYMIQVDYKDKNAAESSTREGIALLGGVDAIVCNAAISDGAVHIDNLLVYEKERMQELITVNLWSYWICARTAARNMVKNQVKGNIVFITSVEGITSMPGMFLYGSLKAATKRSCMTIALDLAPYGIRCNCVAPGFTTVRTTEELHAQGEKDVEWRAILAKRYPLGRVGIPEDTANMVEFLLRDESSNITGEQFRVDGAARTPRMPTWPIKKEIEKSGWCYSEMVAPKSDW